MKKMKKMIVTGAALVACVSTFVGISALNSVTVKAEENFYMDGASVRVSAPSGIRFHTVVNNKTDGCSYGTLIIPKADFTGTALTVDTPNVVNVSAERWRSETEFTVALGGVEKDGVIPNFPKSQYNNEIYACSYVKDANGEYTYTPMISRTLAQVASISLTDNTEENKITDETARSYLADICDYVLGDDGFELSKTSVEIMVGETLDLTSLFADANGNEGLKAIWEVMGGADCVTVTEDELGAIVSLDAKEAGTVTLQAKIGTKTAELTVTTKVREVAENEVIDFQYESDLQRANVGNGGNVTAIEYLNEFEGANGVVKVTHNGWANFTFDPLKDLNEYENYDYLVIRAYLNANDVYSQSLYIAGYQFDHCTTTKMANGVWKDYYFDAELFLEQWKDLGSGYSSLGFRSTGVTYIDSIYMTNTAPHTLINFDNESDLENFSVSEGSTITWVEDNPFYTKVNGGDKDIPLTDGVVKIDYSGSKNHSFSFKLPNSSANYKDYNYVTLYMSIPSSDNQITCIAPQGCGGDVSGYFNNGDNTSWTETSSKYCFAWTYEINKFLNGDTATVNLTAKGTGAGTYYISAIYVSKSITNANLDVTINGDIRGNVEYYGESERVKPGDTISMAMFNPEQYVDIVMTVTDPNGNKISDINNITAVAGTYTITFKHGQRSTSGGYYQIRENNGACYSKSGTTKTITFTVKE